MKRIRIFIGIKLNLIESQKKVKDLFKKEATANIKWTKEDNLHLTFIFIGSIDPKYIKDITNALQKHLNGAQPFSIRIEKCGQFYKRRNRSILWFGVEDSIELQYLHNSIATIVKNVLPDDYDLNIDKYTPHITIARYNKKLQVDINTINENLKDVYQNCIISGVQIIESKSGERGIEYIPIETIDLKKKSCNKQL